MSSTVKRFILYVLGLTLLGNGIGLVILAHVGYGAWDIFYNNFVVLTNTSFMVVETFVAFIMIFIGYFLYKEKPDRRIFYMILNAAYTTVWIDVVLLLDVPSFWIGIPTIMLGVLFVAVGVNLARITNIMLPPMDFMMNAIYQKVPITYGQLKIILEVVILFVGLATAYLNDMPTNIGFGTIYATIFVGLNIDWTYQKTHQFVMKFTQMKTDN